MLDACCFRSCIFFLSKFKHLLCLQCSMITRMFSFSVFVSVRLFDILLSYVWIELSSIQMHSVVTGFFQRSNVNKIYGENLRSRFNKITLLWRYFLTGMKNLRLKTVLFQCPLNVKKCSSVNSILLNFIATEIIRHCPDEMQWKEVIGIL